jgi:hypothetical protein
MGDQQKRSKQETGQKEKDDAEKARRVAKEQERKNAYLAKELAIQKASDSRHSKQAGKRADEETDRLAREETRKKAYSAKEEDIAEAHEARKLRDKEQPP